MLHKLRTLRLDIRQNKRKVNYAKFLKRNSNLGMLLGKTIWLRFKWFETVGEPRGILKKLVEN